MKISLIESDQQLRGAISSNLEKLNLQVALSQPSFSSFIEVFSLQAVMDVLIYNIEKAEDLGQLHKIKRLFPATYLITYGKPCEKEFIHKALENGADAFVIKDKNFLEAMNIAVGSVRVGQSLVISKTNNLLFKEEDKKVKRESSFKQHLLWLKAKNKLKPKEEMVAGDLLKGYTYEETASKNYMSINTVRYYVKSLYRKLEVNSRSSLSALVYSPDRWELNGAAANY